MNIENVAKAINRLSVSYTSGWISCLFGSDFYGRFNRLSDVDAYGSMTDAQACMAIDIFNNYRPLEATEVECVRAIIRPLLAVCLRGARTVSIYYHRRSIAIEDPLMLKKHRYLYLQGEDRGED